MNKEQFKASWEVGPLEEHFKQRWGELAADDLLQVEGDLDKFYSAIEKRYSGMKEEITKWADLWYARWIGSYIDYYADWKPAVGSRF